jgi:HAD superfamily hydrolase (TIGR01459 family)
MAGYMSHTPCDQTPIPILTSISSLPAGTVAWLVDIWGVMHNGVAPFLEAAQATAAFRKSGGIVLLVSNAPRPAHSVIAQIDGIGVPRDAYDAVVSSGDVCRSMLESWRGRPLHHLGPDRDKPIFEGMNLDFVPVETAQVVICTGLLDDNNETAETYRPLLTGMLARATPMICANPDLTVERGNRLVYCAGAIAQLYEALGGKVTYAGKPHLPIYDMAFEMIARIGGKSVGRDGVLAIGDGLRTDIAGAANAGIRSVFIASGVHVEGGRIDSSVLDRLFAEAAARPIAAMQGLAP